MHLYLHNLIPAPDTHDEEPTEELIDIYYYKCGQLREIINKEYNRDDVKRLSSKLAKEQCGQVNVSYIFVIL